jgi:hypothetical protein
MGVAVQGWVEMRYFSRKITAIGKRLDFLFLFQFYKKTNVSLLPLLDSRDEWAYAPPPDAA